MMTRTRWRGLNSRSLAALAFVALWAASCGGNTDSTVSNSVTVFGGQCWHDIDGDAEKDTNEPGLEGVVLELTRSADQVLIGAAVTDANGIWAIKKTEVGTFDLRVRAAPANFKPTSCDGEPPVGDTCEGITVSGGGSFTFNFGFSRFSSAIGNLVWLDANCNGIQDIGETGIEGATVNLYDTGGELVLSTETNSSGLYKFAGLTGGGHVIEVVTAPGLVPSPCNVGADTTIDSECSPVVVDLADDETLDETIDFGFHHADAGIGDLVWDDLNCDGIQDEGEPGIGDVPVRLLAGGELIAEQLTRTDGTYRFAGLCGGDYTIEVDTPPGYVPTIPGAGPDDVDSELSPAPVTLAGGQASDSDGTIDFGFRDPKCGGPSSIGNRVWHDFDCDGLQDEGEPGIKDVPVCLFDAGGQLALVVLSDEEGHYLFDGLFAGTYIIEVDLTGLPPDFEETLCDQGPDDTVDSECGAVIVVLAEDEDNLTIDFGFRTDCCDGDKRIGDFVWNDLDCDGIQDEGEPGLENIAVRLSRGGVAYFETTTDVDGSYEFAGLCAGTYTVEVDTETLPDGFGPTECDAGADDELDSECGEVEVVLTDLDSEDLSIDFGFHSPCCEGMSTIGDRVWDDLDCDGIQDPGELGLKGVKLRLHDSSNVAFGVAVTDAAGHYTFGRLCAGSYTVTVVTETLPAGYTASPCDVGDDGLDNDCSPVTVTLVSDADTIDTVDFGYHPECCGGQGRIGDRVWNDIDCDGIQEPGECGLPGVVLRLLSPGGETLLETVTNADGNYAFSGLCAGTYIIELESATVPDDFVPSPCDTTFDDLDSDCLPALVTLPTDDAVDTTIDFGFHSPCCSGAASIGDRVWNDRNCDGFQDDGEVGLVGVRLKLRRDDGVPFGIAVSDADGAYEFDGLCAGTYIVEVDPDSLPAGYSPSPCNAWSDDTDNDCSPVTVVLPDDGFEDDSVDFGYHGCCGGMSGVGDRTWFDENGNGIFDGGEDGIGGIVVRVYDDTGALVCEIVTPEFGRWKALGLCAGTYTVEAFAPPELGLVPTICDVGPDDKDSDCSPVTVILGDEHIDFTIDFGFVDE